VSAAPLEFAPSPSPDPWTKPRLGELWTTTDVGRYLGITRQGAQQIVSEARDFPLSIGKLGHYTLWWAPEVKHWVSTRYIPRQRGRRARAKARRAISRPRGMAH
jgi:hypothetical protein